MTDSNRVSLMLWALNYCAFVGDTVPLQTEFSNWMKEPGQPWNANIFVRYDGHEGTDVELIIHTREDGFLIDVHGSGVEPMNAFFETFHTAQLAAEQYALESVHRIPIDA